MKTTPLIATLLGLAIVTPAGYSALGAPNDVKSFRLAQAQPKDSEEEDKRSKGNRPGREAEKDKGAAKGAPEKSGDSAGSAKGGETEQQSGRDRARGSEKSKQDAAQDRDTKSKAVEEKAVQPPAQRTQEPAQRPTEPAKQTQEPAPKGPQPTQRTQEPAQRTTDPTQRTTEPVQRTQEPTQRTTEPVQRTQEPTRSQQPSQERQQTQDRDRRGPSGDRARRTGDDEQAARERAEQREKQRTPAQELSKVRVEPGRSTTIDGGRRTIQREGNRVVIRSDDSSRFAARGSQRGNERVERMPDGQTRTIVIYPDGTQIITIADSRGRIVHRSRRGRDGREIVFFREVNRAPLAQINLGPLRISIPREQYIVDSRRASRADLQRVFWARPVEQVDRIYTIDEVRRFDRVRNIMPRLDLDSITFDTGSALIAPTQIDLLADIADIILEMIERNPAEVILIEGHTDLVGSDIYNLALSDRRAEAVAIALTDYFELPPENLVTQGYGESFPKIPTEAAERENRRVAFRRVTPLVSEFGR